MVGEQKDEFCILYYCIVAFIRWFAAGAALRRVDDNKLLSRNHKSY